MCIYVSYVYTYTIVFVGIIICKYLCMYVCLYVHVCILVYVCMYVCMCVCMYVCTFVCMYVCTYVYMCVCMYVLVYVCTYVYGWYVSDSLSSPSSCRSIWHPGGSHSQVATMDDKASLCLWTIEGTAKPQEMNKIQLDSKGRVCHTAVCWSSHHNYTQLLVSADSTLYSWDTRTNM